MVSRPLVTVVTPTRDRAPLLARTLRAALAQRGVALEVVVVDVIPAHVARAVARPGGGEVWCRSAALWHGEGRRWRALRYGALAAVAAPRYTIRRSYRQYVKWSLK